MVALAREAERICTSMVRLQRYGWVTSNRYYRPLAAESKNRSSGENEQLLFKFKVPQLREMLSTRGISKTSRLRKPELISKLQTQLEAENISIQSFCALKSATPGKQPPAEIITVYTDGCCFRNGKANSQAGVGVYFGSNDKRNISEPLTGSLQTNQRAEITAAIRSLQSVPTNSRVVLLTDSIYVVNGKRFSFK